MRNLTERDRQEAREEIAIWNHGKLKANITNAIKLLKLTTVKDHPDIKKAIETLEAEREKLKKKEIF